MAYNETEERLKVRGSEQITRDLKVNRDTFINGKVEAGSIEDKGDLRVTGEIIADDDITVKGDLYVNGTEYINNSETAQTTDNYLVLRHNQTAPLGTDEYSGVAVHNYASGKTATITTDKDGTWRVADNTETDTNYTNLSYYNGTYYTGLTRTTATVISGMKTAFDEDELDESVYYNTSYYHFDGNNWFPVSLVSNKLTLGSIVTDSATITALNALTKHDLVYFRTLTITVINPVENQPLLTRSEVSDLSNGQALTWDATNQKAVGKTIDITVASGSSHLITSGAVSTCVTNAINALDVASVGGSGKYISAICEANGKITATATTMDTAPTASSTNAVTSGGVKTAFDNEVTARNTAITNAINALDVASAGGAGKYISAISETNGKISATATTMDTAPTANSTNAATSGGIKTAINTAETNAKNLANAIGTLAVAHGGTGVTSQDKINCNIIADLAEGNSDVTDGTMFVSSYASDNGFADTNAVNKPYKRQFVHVWNYIKGKISSVLGLTETAYGGKAATAGTADQADKGKNGSAYCAFGSNAFNSTAFTTCVGTVTIADKAAANANTPVALCTGATTVGKSSSCGLNFNTCTGVLSMVTLSATNVCGSSYVRAPVAMSAATSGASKVNNVTIRACCTNASCTLTCRDFVFCGSTGYMHGNVCGNLCGTASSAVNSTCFGGCTFAQACTAIRSGLTSCTGTVTSVKVGSTSYSPSSGVISLPAYPAAQVQSDWNVTDSSSMAFIKNKPTIGTGDVTIADKAATNEGTPIALCTGAKTVGKSGSCGLDFNTDCGYLYVSGVGSRSGWGTIVSTDYIYSYYNSSSGNCCFLKVCTGNSSGSHTFCFSEDGYMHGNVCGNVNGRADCAVCIPNSGCTCWYRIYVC